MSEFVHFLKSLCLPAKIYLGLIFVNFFSMILIKKEKKELSILATTFIFIILIGLAMAWFGNYLCSQGFEVITWLIVLLPILTLVRNVRKLM